MVGSHLCFSFGDAKATFPDELHMVVKNVIPKFLQDLKSPSGAVQIECAQILLKYGDQSEFSAIPQFHSC